MVTHIPDVRQPTVTIPESEYKALNDQVTALQTRCTQLELENRGVPAQVREFQHAIGVAVPNKPMVPDDDEIVRMRMALVTEEFFELVDATFGPLNIFIQLAKLHMDHAVKTAPLYPVLRAVADALADLDYVVEGTRLAFGINGKPIAAEVHRSNMTKIGAPRRADGKILKGENYSPPNIHQCLINQGWEQ